MRIRTLRFLLPIVLLGWFCSPALAAEPKPADSPALIQDFVHTLQDLWDVIWQTIGPEMEPIGDTEDGPNQAGIGPGPEIPGGDDDSTNSIGPELEPIG